MGLVLVTGGAGFIGSHLAAGLAARGGRVRVLDDLSGGTRENLAPLEPGEVGSGAPVELCVGDIRDPRAVERACQGVTAVLHEAAQVSVPGSFDDPVESYAINVQGTLRVLEAARRAGAERFLLASSSAVYGDDPELPKVEAAVPRCLSPYASGKLAGEELLAVWGRAHGMATVALRYFNVYGPRQSDSSPYSGVIALFARKLLAGEPVTIWGDGGQTRDFVFVEDVVRANLAALEAEVEPGAVFNVGSGEETSILELHRTMARILERDPEPVHGAERVGDVRHSVASGERARRELGFEVGVGLEEGLRLTLDWYRGRG